MIPIAADFECISHGRIPDIEDVRVIALQDTGELIDCRLHICQHEDLCFYLLDPWRPVEHVIAWREADALAAD